MIALPLGVWLGHIHRGSFLAINVSNLGRALPSLAVISVGLPALGIGHTVVVLALVVLVEDVQPLDEGDQVGVEAGRACPGAGRGHVGVVERHERGARRRGARDHRAVHGERGAASRRVVTLAQDFGRTVGFVDVVEPEKHLWEEGSIFRFPFFICH